MRYIRTYVCIILLYGLNIPEVSAQISRTQAIAAYINNFAKYITWPDEYITDSFRILLYTDNNDLIEELIEFSSKRLLKEKPVDISVQHYGLVSGNIQIVLVTSDKTDNLLDIYNAVDGKPILLISEEYPDKRNVMINFYETRQKQLLFEVNRANIISQNLTTDSEILLAGGTEIDVAALYRQSQLDLRVMQKNMDLIKDSLQYYDGNIRDNLVKINKQQTELTVQKDLLTESYSRLNEQNKEIVIQKSILKSQKETMDQKNIILSNQQKEIRNQLNEVERLEKILKRRQKTMEDLNIEIESKNIILDNQFETIARQKQILLLVIAVGLLILILIVTILIGYQNNRKKNRILSIQKKEIEEQLAELKELNIKLQNADQYKSIFLASMSHELRTPLNSIIGYTGILLMGMTGSLNEEQNIQLGKVKNNAQHLLSLINDILEISKIEADRIELHPEEFNLKDLIHEIVDVIQPRVIEKNLQLTIAIPKDLVMNTDNRRLKQVLLNLVSNAVNYSEKGEIHISSSLKDENSVRISVRDSGIGIAENELSRLFQPFQQIDSSLTKKNKGTGLGLYLCRKLITLMKGNIYVTSELNKGSEFFIELPVNIS